MVNEALPLVRHDCHQRLGIYKRVNTVKGKLQKKLMKLTDFRTEFADTLYRYQNHSKNKRGRPSTNSRQDTTVPSKRPRTGVQVLVSIGHEKIFMDSRNKCRGDRGWLTIGVG